MQFSREPTAEVQALIDAYVTGKGFFTRFFAYFLDLMVLIVVYALAGAVFNVVVFLPIAVALGVVGRDYTVGEQVPALASWLLALVLSIVYTAGMEASAGATVGKVILGMRVANCQGRLPSVGQAVLRGILRLADGLLFGIVAYIQMKRPLQQRLGDKIARTVVVSVRSPFIEERRPWWVFVVAFLAYCVISGLSTVLLSLTTIWLN